VASVEFSSVFDMAGLLKTMAITASQQS
jgi:hypothetical protein